MRSVVTLGSSRLFRRLFRALTRMATIHYDCAKYSSLHSLHKDIENIVINDLAVFVKVYWNYGFVIAVVFVATNVNHTPPMTREANKDDIAGLTVLCQTNKAIHNVLPGRHHVFTIVLQNQHFFLSETLSVDKVVLDIFSVIMTRLELTRLSDIIDTDYLYSRSCRWERSR